MRSRLKENIKWAMMSTSILTTSNLLRYLKLYLVTGIGCGVGGSGISTVSDWRLRGMAAGGFDSAVRKVKSVGFLSRKDSCGSVWVAIVGWKGLVSASHPNSGLCSESHNIVSRSGLRRLL